MCNHAARQNLRCNFQAIQFRERAKGIDRNIIQIQVTAPLADFALSQLVHISKEPDPICRGYRFGPILSPCPKSGLVKYCQPSPNQVWSKSKSKSGLVQYCQQSPNYLFTHQVLQCHKVYAGLHRDPRGL